MAPSIIWDSEDDEQGNYHHIVTEGHGITQEEVDEPHDGQPDLLRLDDDRQVHRCRLRGVLRRSDDTLPDHSVRGPRPPRRGRMT